MDPLVSILIPAYNAERWIADTLRSALAQTWPRKEIIVIDDGSRDGTLEIARQFKNVTVESQPNQGAAAARNRAYALSSGDYIQWLDADDLLAPDKIQRQIEAAAKGRNERALFSSAWGSFVYRASGAKFSPSALWRDLQPIECLLRMFEEDLFMQPGAWLVSRSLTEKAGIWDTRLSLDDDGEYFCRVIRNCDRIQFVSEARMYYRRGFDSLSSLNRASKKLDSQFLSLQLQASHLCALEASDRVRAACLKFLQRWVIVFYPERLDIVAQLRKMAKAHGGELQDPRLPWKYAWIQRTFGWSAAKRVKNSYNQLKTSVIRACDKARFELEKRTATPDA